MTDVPTIDIKGGWAFLSFASKTIAHRLNASDELELTGAFHRAHRDRSGELSLLGELLQGDASEMVAASAADSEPLTLESVLRGTGWSVVFVELTGRCNERCLHCYASASPEITTELPWETLANVIDDVGKLGFARIQFTGGEALLSSHLVPAVQRARAAGISHIEIYTNGLALRPALLQLLAEAGVGFAFSVYSHRPDVHDAVTNVEGSHGRTLDAIRAALGAGLDVRVGAILREENQNDLVALRALLKSMGVPEQRIGADRERAVGRGAFNHAVSLDSQLNQNVHASFPRQQGAGKLSVLYDGTVAPCIFDRKTVLGRLGPKTGLLDVLRQPVRARSRASYAKNKLALVPAGSEQLSCGSCQARHELLQHLSW